jgi:O-antigen/teichoic acid export membrane protein
VPLAALIIVPPLSAAFAYGTVLFVSSSEIKDEASRTRVRRQAWWTAAGTAAATLLTGLLMFLSTSH